MKDEGPLMGVRTPAMCLRARPPRGLAVAIAVAVTATLALAATASAKSTTVWLCKPGKKPDPCQENREATVVTYNGDTCFATSTGTNPSPPTLLAIASASS